MRAFESLGDMFTTMVDTLRSPAKQKFDGVPRWVGGRIKIQRPADDVYDFWRSSTNLPKVLRIVQSLTIHEGGITQWVLRGQTGERVAFTCEQVVEDPGHRIEWRSTKDAPVHSVLNVTFARVDDSVSELVVGWTVALKPDQGDRIPLTLDGLFDPLTLRMLDDDLDRLRTLMNEEGARIREEAAAREQAELRAAAAAARAKEEGSEEVLAHRE